MHCPFCQPRPWEIFHESERILGLWNAYPVTAGHALLVTRRHLPDWFAASLDEQQELTAAVGLARRAIEEKFQPEGYNVGLNCGEAAGQTVFHLHLHVLPRYSAPPASEPETRMLIPSAAHPRLMISNFLGTISERLGGACLFDFVADLDPEDLLLILGGVERMLGNGGHLRAVLGEPAWRELADRYPGRVELFVLEAQPFRAFRVRSREGDESIWLGGPRWHYEVRDRDGLREIRRAFEGLLTHPELTVLKEE